MPKVLLCEIISDYRFDHHRSRSEIFPFIKGFIKNYTKTEWIVLAIPHNPNLTERYLIKLKTKDLNLLTNFIKDKTITHIIFNESFNKLQLKILKRKFKNLKTLSIGDMTEYEQSKLKFDNGGWLSEWLRLKPEFKSSSNLLDYVIPDYYSIKLNSLAKKIKPLVRILCGYTCGYSKPIKKNPYYKNIDFTEAYSNIGCTFCIREDNTNWPYKISLMGLVFKQLIESYKAYQDNSNALEYWIEGFNVFNKLEVFFDKLMSISFPPANFYFQCRIDDISSKSKTIEKLLPKLKKYNYAIKLFSMGIENFSPTENARFNKGLTVANFHKCYELMKCWNKNYPHNFIFQENGLFSFILFTPWTTLDDLEINIKWLKYFGLNDEWYLRTKLQLLPKRAITFLAEKEGVLVKKNNDVPFDSGCIKFKGINELHWKFKDEQVALIYHIISNLYIIKHPENEKFYIKSVPSCIKNFAFKQVSLFIIFRILIKLIKNSNKLLSAESIVQLTEEYIKDLLKNKNK